MLPPQPGLLVESDLLLLNLFAFILSFLMYVSFQVAEFSPVDVKPNQITFRWTLPPDEENGILLGFKIKYGIKVRMLILVTL